MCIIMVDVNGQVIYISRPNLEEGYEIIGNEVICNVEYASGIMNSRWLILILYFIVVVVVFVNHLSYWFPSEPISSLFRSTSYNSDTKLCDYNILTIIYCPMYTQWWYSTSASNYKPLFSIISLENTQKINFFDNIF